MKPRLLAWFLLAQVLASLFVFRDALWGKSLLAPLDIAPAFFPKYRYLNPASSGVPANHWIIDQLTYDLPEQWTIYKAWRRGEIPWWDPYTWCGRPLLTDAAISGTDPVRVLGYLLLPFEVAYNWIRVVHFVLSGLGMLLLLRRFGFSEWSCLLFALAFEFSGNFIMHFGHPFLQASFLYYPFLWLLWDMALAEGKRWCWALAPVVVAAIFYAGSLQSHAYILVFALAFGLGCGGFQWSEWKKLLPLMASSGLLGGCLASPIVFSEIELYLVGDHTIGAGYNRFSCLEGIASFSAVYPWLLGTFRTLDVSKLFDQPQPLGFIIFIGSAAFVLALVGASSRTQKLDMGRARRTAGWLCALYFFIVSTPLVQVLYVRCATLASMGLIVLAAFGLEEAAKKSDFPRNWGRLILILTLSLAVLTNVFAWVVYPKLLPTVRRFVETHKSKALDDVPSLRRFQVENLPREISFQNPETLLAWLSLLGAAVLLLKPGLRRSQILWTWLLVLNLLPSVIFCQRFVPRQPISQWRRLLEGGPEQQKVEAMLRDTPMRLWEPGALRFDKVFPFAMSHLYGVRTVHGYASMRPYSPNVFSSDEQAKYKEQLADWIYEPSAQRDSIGKFVKNSTASLARFQWLDSSARSFTVEQVGLNGMRLSFAPGAGGSLLWTDNFFPGWRALVDGVKVKLKRAEPCFSRIDVPAPAKTLVLEYRPRFLSLAEILACLGLVSIAALAINPRLPKRESR